jgi:hypothetical protein
LKRSCRTVSGLGTLTRDMAWVQQSDQSAAKLIVLL